MACFKPWSDKDENLRSEWSPSELAGPGDLQHLNIHKLSSRIFSINCFDVQCRFVNCMSRLECIITELHKHLTQRERKKERRETMKYKGHQEYNRREKDK